MDNAFKVVKNGQTLDYRVPKILNLIDVINFFSAHYKVVELQQTGRHITGTLNDGRSDLFLKLSTTEGISIVGQNEYHWNEEYNKHENPKFRVPRNVTSGEYNGLFYSLAEKLTGDLLGSVNDQALHPQFESLIPDLIDFADYISSLHITNVGRPDAITGTTPQEKFINKTKSWFEAIPNQIQLQHGLVTLLAAVEAGGKILETKPRHGDFTPWHLMKIPTGFALLDGEHAMSDGVELYDIGYLIQRVHTVSKKPEIAVKIFQMAETKGHKASKIKTILQARAIGGYLDAHLANKTDLTSEDDFKSWISTI